MNEPKGIINLGNTCFINVCIQLLYHTHEFRDIIDSANIDTEKKEYHLFQQWKEIQDQMTKIPPNSILIPKLFMRHVAEYSRQMNRPIFGPQDSSEFLGLFLDAFHCLMKRPVQKCVLRDHTVQSVDLIVDSCDKWIQEYLQEYSEIAELFYGAYYSKITSVCEKVLSIKPEMFFTLDLPVQTSSIYHRTVDECLNALFLPERLEGDNAWYNEATQQKQPIDKHMCIWKFPNILILLFKRFSFDGTKTKDSLIDFQIDGFRLNQNSPTYDLYGVWNHYGNVDNGHYTTMIKNNKEWYHYNDHLIEKIDPSKLATEYTYCLFYRKRK